MSADLQSASAGASFGGESDAHLRSPRTIVTQLGARRHYLVPVTFASRGMLVRFYTDLYLNGWSGWCASQAAKITRLAPLRRLAGRRDLELPDELVSSFPSFALHSAVRARWNKRRGELTRSWLWSGRQFGRCVVAQGFAHSDAIYAYSSAALEMFEAARREGKFCILDQATAPKRVEDALTMRQAERYPGWSASPPREDRWVDEYADRQNQEAELADLIICGSTFVKQAVQEETGQGQKCVIVPLGMRQLPANPAPKSAAAGRRLRLLFVGDEAIRKGIGDFYHSVRQFGVDRCEARVAGNTDLSEQGRTEVDGTLTLLGPVPRVEMASQYQWADVCVLPSISDTFGLVILEALAHGVPVITTPNTGGADVISEGVNGYIVPVMAPEAIADRLNDLDADRTLLASLSEAATARSREFGLDRYAERLVRVVRERFREFQNSSVANTSEE